MNESFLDSKSLAVEGLDPKYLMDFSNYKPNTDYSVTLDFKKEFIRHKRIMCSLKEFIDFDIQNMWDIGYCKTFCDNGNRTNLGVWEA